MIKRRDLTFTANGLPQTGWEQFFSIEEKKAYYQRLMEFVQAAYKNETCYPPNNQIWAAFHQCPFYNLKVVIIGQDPYHGEGQANGLSFSVADGVAIPPSLLNIFKEITADLEVEPFASGDLTRWANQGVLLLNATLTVAAQRAGSHQKKGWETLTNAVIKYINEQCRGIVFMLWGGMAKQKGRIIDRDKHIVLESGHPSPLSANRGYWFGNQHFSKANKQLTSPIDWR